MNIESGLSSVRVDKLGVDLGFFAGAEIHLTTDGQYTVTIEGDTFYAPPQFIPALDAMGAHEVLATENNSKRSSGNFEF